LAHSLATTPRRREGRILSRNPPNVLSVHRPTITVDQAAAPADLEPLLRLLVALAQSNQRGGDRRHDEDAPA
jgi:hypothetical protein